MSAMKEIFTMIQEIETVLIPKLSRTFEDIDIEGMINPVNYNYNFLIKKDDYAVKYNFLLAEIGLEEIENILIKNISDLRLKEVKDMTNTLNNKVINDDFSQYMNPPVEEELIITPDIKEDVVNHPSHYTSGAHECIDVMEAMFGTEAVISFCKCNIFKYRFRADKKNGEEDIKKAEWYESKLMELEKKFKKLDGSDVIQARYY